MLSTPLNGMSILSFVHVLYRADTLSEEEYDIKSAQRRTCAGAADRNGCCRLHTCERFPASNTSESLFSQSLLVVLFLLSRESAW